MSFLAMLGASVAGALSGSLGNSISNSISQSQQFQNNKALQENSFKHDFEMLNAQVTSSAKLAEAQLKIRRDLLLAAGYTPTDAARGAAGLQTTRLLDWNGTRYFAPQAAITSQYTGNFTPVPVSPKGKAKPPVVRPTPRAPSLASSGSWGQPMASNSTLSSRLSTSSGSRSSRPSLPPSWYTGSSRSLEPFAPGALQTAFVTPPGSVSSRASTRSSASTVSTVDERLLTSWKPFNLRNQPGFTRFHPGALQMPTRGHAE
ncbi:VP2 [Bat norovirus]|uniref:VP2 n=1 Tax=Bat norovirus TaxID=1514709 RepID=A0A2S1TZU1_NORV|nr:VP2 [Bat norovirus]